MAKILGGENKVIFMALLRAVQKAFNFTNTPKRRGGGCERTKFFPVHWTIFDFALMLQLSFLVEH